MADIIYKGLFEAWTAGDLVSPDVRLMLVMPGTTCDTEQLAVHVEDITTVDEFDGVGYSEQTCTTVTFAYVDGDLQMQLNMDSAVSFGDPVAPGSDIIQGMLVKLYIDGTDANDYVLAYTETGGFGGNANNGILSLTIPAAGLIYAEQV